jgi:hypothetical protein
VHGLGDLRNQSQKRQFWNAFIAQTFSAPVPSTHACSI